MDNSKQDIETVSHEYGPPCVASRRWGVRIPLSKPRICGGVLHCDFDVFGACNRVALLGRVGTAARFEALAEGATVVVASCLAVGALVVASYLAVVASVVASCLAVVASVVVASCLTVGA